METLIDRLSRQWRDIVNLVLAIWLFVSPWVLGYQGVELAQWNAWILGVIVGVAAISAIAAFHEWEEWVSALLGVWLIVSPWILGLAGSAAVLWNQIVVGVLVVGLALWSVWDARHRDVATT